MKEGNDRYKFGKYNVVYFVEMLLILIKWYYWSIENKILNMINDVV